MAKIIASFSILIFSASPVFAYSYPRPLVERDCLSGNKSYVAHITPATKETKARLDVYKLQDAERMPLWHCTLGNKGAPQYVFLSDDGQHVATVNEFNHGGMNDYVVAFYNPDGLTKNYSLEQILHYPNKIDRKQFHVLVSHIVGSRGWASKPIFLDRHGKDLHLCVWLSRGKRWLAWDARTGDELEATDQRTNRWNERGRQWARSAATGLSWHTAVSFLGNLKNPSDRAVVESLLEDAKFHSHRDRPFFRYFSYSVKRSRADQILAMWDGEKSGSPPVSVHVYRKYRYLGTVEGEIRLSSAPKSDAPRLFIGLIPTHVPKDSWHEKLPAHRLTESFSSYLRSEGQWSAETIPFSIRGVTPGQYYVKAVWDEVGPYYFGSQYLNGPPQPGDFQNIESPRIIVTAGEMTQIGVIDCTHKVTDATN
jgi:hypothetical protein